MLEKKGDAAGAAEQYRESARRSARIAGDLDADLRRAFDARAEVREVADWLAAHAAPRPGGGGAS